MTDCNGVYIPPDQEDGNRERSKSMPASIVVFPRLVPEELDALVRPPDETSVRLATNQLIAALWNYRQITQGHSDDIVSYLDVPEIQREWFYRNYAVPAAIYAIWRDEDEERA